MKNSQGFEISPGNVNKSISSFIKRNNSVEEDINPANSLLKLKKILQQ